MNNIHLLRQILMKSFGRKQINIYFAFLVWVLLTISLVCKETYFKFSLVLNSM